jgi:DNA repair photolyase
MIISVSRRCDIPRFRFQWFLERLDMGFADVVNPFNRSQVRRVSLAPADTEAFVFWTRDPRNILEHTAELEDRGYRFYVMTTLTGYPKVLEPDVPPPDTICAAMACLTRIIGIRRVIWRYDPLFLSSVTDENFHCRNFSTLAERLRGTVQRVIVSVYDEYGGAKRRLAALEKEGLCKPFPHYDDTGLSLPGLRRLLAELAETAVSGGMEIQSCAEAGDLYPPGIKPGACVDGALIKELWGIESSGKDKNQRPYCLCAASVDIGEYGACPAGCVYCYARR